MAFYRNQTPTMDQIKMMGNMRITTPAEATAFLRTLPNILAQVAYVTQRIGINDQREINRNIARPVEEVKIEQPAPVVETPKEFVPEDMDTEEGYSEKEIEARVAKLKSAKKVKKDESSSKEKGN